MTQAHETSIAEGVALRRNQHGREFIEIVHANVNARIALEGAHIVSCTPAGQKDLLWLSPQEPELPGAPLRGGIPICWPWFGNQRPGPAHGVARSALWVLHDLTVSKDQVRVCLELPSTTIERLLLEEQWQLSVEFVLGQELQVTLVTTNTGTQVQPLGQALHTYLPVSDIDRVEVLGLDGCAYLDQLTGHTEQQAGAVRFTGEVDRIYQGDVTQVTLVEPADRIEIHATGSRSTVVWNPWRDKALRLGHFPADGYQHMLCIESANAGADVRVLQPGETHRLTARIRRP